MPLLLLRLNGTIEVVVDDDDCVGDKESFSLTYDTLRVFSIFTNAYACQSVSKLRIVWITPLF